MGNVRPLACNWLLLDGARKILEEGSHTVNTINSLLQYIKETLDISGVSIRQTIPRPHSVRIMYEYVKNTPMQRINETITYTKAEWDFVVETYRKGYYIMDNKDGMDHLVGVDADSCPECVIQFPYFSEGIFAGTLDLIDFKQERSVEERDAKILEALKNLIFDELIFQDTENNKNNVSSEDGYRDYITNLSRYEDFVQKLDQLLPEYVSENNAVLIVYSDIHHFKLINESYGYRKGDELLRAFAKHLHDGEPFIDACRIYSDNFIVAYSVPKAFLNAARNKVELFHESLSQKLREYCPDNHIRICSGIYCIEDINTDISTAIAYANTARKQSKRQKGLHTVQFSPEMIQDMKWRSYINNELPRAINKHNLVVYYHPKISCDSNRLLGAEALIRWRQDDGSFIYPDQFIPEFESNGNIIKLDYYVYEEVFRYLNSRLENELPVVPISMNVSRTHLENDDILAYIQLLVNKYNVPAKFIEFELTENIYMNSYESARLFIKTCNSMGISVSMDDFGSGYSSLNMISDLDIDIIKIDKIFMRHANLSENDKIVLSSVIDMAKRLNMIVLCEGVETESQVDFLKEAGCDIIQGYYYARPMCQQEFDDFIMMDYMNS
jgi:diguanylate cyclase (GGDEF)-like protein